jgi:hypothetical protein
LVIQKEIRINFELLIFLIIHQLKLSTMAQYEYDSNLNPIKRRKRSNTKKRQFEYDSNLNPIPETEKSLSQRKLSPPIIRVAKRKVNSYSQTYPWAFKYNYH